ncbi:3-methyl-2-oxobutanoate hydroxymethyltransferase [Bosea sp. BK604]|uniref:3-methyl-2-oxobutanoate hydroxymethyltransferase n=1 Tax=Bosea sp. BK604 TaxID=2512180 RepID=UPI001046ABDB|nr:3-methyl-2-oxobutanoate hydroxymethyltransferase [Bosea sp. BK604]TCR66353.1 ketopantoate hydroxymethyltransferase [Bosea sp. BK604]
MTYLSDTRPLALGDFARMRAAGEKAVMLTCYDSSFASLLDGCGVELLLVGDSMGNVLQGHATTLPVTMEQMAYHTACVARGAKRAFIVADMPFGSYQEGPAQAVRNAAALMKAGAHMVKLEGGAYVVETARFLVERGIPVCGHLGLTPQTVHQLGGYRVQGKTADAASRLKADAAALEQAGASLLVLEMVPSSLAAEITASSASLSTIGIGAGVACHGQVLVLHDAIGVYPGKSPRFSRNFMAGSGSIQEAIQAYVTAVKAGTFPGPEHSY